MLEMDMNKKMLLLDRDNDILNLAHEIMFYGYSEMHITSNPNSVYDIAVNYKPDLIILDSALIEEAHDAFFNKIKSIKALEKTILIVVSKTYNCIINNLAPSADTIFLKPLDNREFADKISYLMAS